MFDLRTKGQCPFYPVVMVHLQVECALAGGVKVGFEKAIF